MNYSSNIISKLLKSLKGIKESGEEEKTTLTSNDSVNKDNNSYSSEVPKKSIGPRRESMTSGTGTTGI